MSDPADNVIPSISAAIAQLSEHRELWPAIAQIMSVLAALDHEINNLTEDLDGAENRICVLEQELKVGRGPK